MKFLFVFCSLLAAAHAAPAVVWKKNEGGQNMHSSESIAAGALLKGALESSSVSVVFLVGKDEQGGEALSELASSGKLPATQEKYGLASVYHHVSGVESTAAMVREASRHTDDRVLSISMKEWNQKINPVQDVEVDETGAMQKKNASKRARQLAESKVLIVNVNPKEDAAEIDRSVANAIDNEMVGSVLLMGVRSIHEVKHERMLVSQQRRLIMQKEGEQSMDARRRRLEQQAAGDDEVQGNNNDMSGVYYVAMTPNILAALLFMGLFTVITWIGISCMGDISGQDVFVSKMPSIGREA